MERQELRSVISSLGTREVRREERILKGARIVVIMKRIVEERRLEMICR